MVPGINTETRSAEPDSRGSRMAWTRILFEIVVAVLAVGVFALKIANYADPAVLRLSVISNAIAVAAHNTVSAIENLRGPQPLPERPRQA